MTNKILLTFNPEERFRVYLAINGQEPALVAGSIRWEGWATQFAKVVCSQTQTPTYDYYEFGKFVETRYV